MKAAKTHMNYLKIQQEKRNASLQVGDEKHRYT